MTPKEFQRHLDDDPYLSRVVGEAARAGQQVRTFGILTEAAVVALMFPIVRYVLYAIGLPWLSELRRYSELQRQRVHDWIDTRYQQHGFDPDQAEAASTALLDELEQTTDQRARTSWQQLAALIEAKGDDE
jgi:hypothetical protein